jgi:DNA repair exonuclease SbcCD ATPase subunit
MSAMEVIRRKNKKNKKLQAELDKKKDTQELEQMITKLKVQIEEDKRIEEALKEQLEGKDGIIVNLEAEIVSLRKDIQRKICRIAQKFCMTLLAVKNLILTSPDLDTIKQKIDQASKQQSKKQIQKVMQKQSKGIKRYTRKITGTLLHREHSDFRINNR